MSEIILTDGLIVLVDEEDYEYLNKWKWYKDKNGYACRNGWENGKDKFYMMHRVIMKYPKGKFIDHIDGNTLNNQKSNLRICDRKDNAKNRFKNYYSKSKYKGLSWDNKYKQWKVSIRSDNEILYIGRFLDEDAAANAYNHYAKIYHKEYAKLNDCPEINNWSDYRLESETSSSYRGVSWDKKRSKWIVAFKIDGKDKFRVCFTNEIAAANAYNFYALEYLKDKAKLNNVEFMDKSEWEQFMNKRESPPKSKYIGVHLHTKTKKWISRIGINGGRLHIGSFEEEIDAAKAYNTKAIELFGDKAKLNIIGGDENRK